MSEPEITYHYIKCASKSEQMCTDHGVSDRTFGGYKHTIRSGLEYTSIVDCAYTNLLDGFILGFGISSIVSFVSNVVRGRANGGGRSSFSSSSLRSGIFCAVLLGSYNTTRFLSCGSFRFLRARQRKVLIGLVIGCFSSILSKRLRRFLALFLVTRALEAKSKSVYRGLPSRYQKTLSPIVPYSHVLLASFSTGINAMSRFMRPELLEPSYKRFLDSACGYSQRALSDLNDVCNRRCSPERHCSALHAQGKGGCPGELLKFSLRHFFGNSLRFYYRLYAIPLIFTALRARRFSFSSLHRFAKKTLRSSLFLTTGGTAMTAVFCINDRLKLPITPALPLLSGMCSGGVLWIEPETRRPELSLYLFAQALYVMARFYAARGWWYPNGLDLIAIGIGSYQMISAFEDKELLRSFDRRALQAVFDHPNPNGTSGEQKMHGFRATRWLSKSQQNTEVFTVTRGS
jgi:hypothetical protein